MIAVNYKRGAGGGRSPLDGRLGILRAIAGQCIRQLLRFFCLRDHNRCAGLSKRRFGTTIMLRERTRIAERIAQPIKYVPSDLHILVGESPQYGST